MLPILGPICFVTVLCCLPRSAAETDQCEEAPRPEAGTGLLQAKSHLDPSRLQEVDEPDLAFASFAGESWAAAQRLQELDVNSSLNKLAVQCRKRKAKAHVPLVVAEQLHQQVRDARATASRLKSRKQCPGELTLRQFFRNLTVTSCCPRSSTECAGCALFSDGKCQECEGGYVRQNGTCVACLSTIDWINENGESCDRIKDCNDRPVNGQSSNQACCQCSGGHKSPTPFRYADKRFAVGAAIHLEPLPRTATRYSLNSGCNLAAYNLTMDGTTGVISYQASTDLPVKAFSVQCEVTAHQGAKLEETVKVSVVVEYMTYPSAVLIFSHDTPSYSVASTQTMKDFGMVCAPEQPWLSVDASGTVTSSTGTAGGAVTAVDEFATMDGAVCVVSATEGASTKRTTSFAAIRPRPWPELVYEESYAEVVVGEQLPPLRLKTPKGYEEGTGGLKPTSFAVNCSFGFPVWSYDRNWGVGTIYGHQFLEVAPDGSITLAPGESMAEMFDELEADQLRRKSIEMHCGVFGMFPGTDFEPIFAPMIFKVKDSMCWVSESFSGEVVYEKTYSDEPKCRNGCRQSKVCSHFMFFPPETCKHFRINNVGGAPLTAYAKVTDCTDLSTCIRLKHPEWIIAGDYCPVAYDLRRGGPVYRKDSEIPQEVMYLASVPTTSTTACGAGHWLVQRAKPEADYVDSKLGYFELAGEELLCLQPGIPSSKTVVEANVTKNISLNWATLPCGQPLTHEVEDGQLHPLVFDDPTTLQPDDYWLHPCDCIPPEWGLHPPANPLVAEGLPAASDGSFIPPPLLIVQGQFACPSRQLLSGKRGMYFETEAEAFEKADCQERCKDFVDCQFYWTGTSHGAQTCRLFNGCDSLVREFGMDGDLYALPQNKSCLVANPEVCWKTTLRRQFLTQKVSVSPSFTHSSALFNAGGLADFRSNASRTLDREFTYEEKLGDISSVKFLGWTEIFKPFGFVRSLGGLASATVQGLNPNQEYEWELLTSSNQKEVKHKVAVNHGAQMNVGQPEIKASEEFAVMMQGKSKSTPRGELVFDFEASDFALGPQDLRSGPSSSIATMSCPSGTKMTHCSCYADSGVCAGAKMEPASGPRTCRAYGSRDVSGGSSRAVSVRAHVRCMRLTYLRNLQVVTSGGASFSFLQNGAADNNLTQLLDVDEEDVDVEVSLDADGHTQEEMEDEEEKEEEEALEPEEDSPGDEHTEAEFEGLEDEEDEHSEDDAGEDEDLEGEVSTSEDSEDEDESGHGIALTQEGTQSVSSVQSWRRRRRRRRRRRAPPPPPRRRRSRRRRSRRRRSLPAQVSASCPNGKRLLTCSCYPDSFLEKQSHWTDVRHHCKRVWRSGTKCFAKGGYAQALCGDLEAPAARAWQDREASGKYWTNKEEGPVASCPSETVLLGCWCQSTSGAEKDCTRLWTDGNRCRATTGPGRVTTVHVNIKITARCADLRASALILSGINLTRVTSTSLLQDTPDANSAESIVPFASKSFSYMHLFQQCDALLLMGGLGVETCSRPSYREPSSHAWRGKRPLPSFFLPGTELKVGCWHERYQSFRAGFLQPGENLHCVNGDWYNSLQLPELTAFVCEPCVLVAGKGYTNYVRRQQQELYYFSRMAMRVYTELGSLAATHSAAQKYCLFKEDTAQNASAAGGNMTLQASAACPEILALEVVGSAEVEDRMMALLDYGVPDHGQCLEALPAADGVSPSLGYQKCDLENERQLISPMALPGVLWDMHKEADRTHGEDFHKAFGSYCGAHGALSSLAFGQVFAGDASIKSTCRFAPVIQFGEFLDTAITYDKRSQDWPEWNTLLADSPVQCPDGEALTGFKLLPARNIFRYECSRIGGLGASYEYFSAQVEVKKFDQTRANWIGALRMIKVDCGDDALLSGFHFEFSEGGRWARSKFMCSKAGGAPVVMEPSTTIEAMSQTPEGVFCPLEPDAHTGRYRYINANTGDTLFFDRSGKWCVGPDCSLPVGGANPVGVVMTIFEVQNVTDFDGHFEGKGVPAPEGGGMDDLAKKLKAIKPPKRPAQPPKPKLQEYKAQMPKYADECLDYQDLWNKVIETHKNAENEEVVEESKLEPDEGTVDAELPDYHPCQIVQSNSFGIFGRLAGDDGKYAPENMLYKDWRRCMSGDISRDMLSGYMEFGNSLYHSIANVVHTAVKLVCASIPNVEVAPLGAGVEPSPPKICGEVTDLVRTIVDLPFDISKQSVDLATEIEGYNACNPYESGFSRLFCDIHCVRDAVIRGDRTILQNLEQATKISNDNMRKMVEWSTEATRTETEYLDKKIDHSLKINTIYLHHIAKNTQPKEEELLQNAAAATGSMLTELKGFAEVSSFGTSRLTARDALQRFIDTAQPFVDGNATRSGQVQKFQGQLSDLYQTMRASTGGLTRAQVVGRQVASEAQELQARTRQQAQVLGIYRAHSRAAHKAAKSWKQSDAETVLVTLDKLWWRMRDRLDRYLDVAGEEILQIERSFAALAEYENCKAGTVDLLRSYSSGMKSMRRSRSQLRAVWRETSNLMGELAAIISDGDVFGHLMDAEGCGSSLASQTLDQIRFVLQDTGFLIHRFQVANLPEPDVSVLQAAVKQIHGAYASARSSCTATAPDSV